ncbi:MAG: TonB-dependent receptor [Deltaproteobacteria bacterium]|nr:TonB-dependent receptor [Deltaproteobacteria bacterium]
MRWWLLLLSLLLVAPALAQDAGGDDPDTSDDNEDEAPGDDDDSADDDTDDTPEVSEQMVVTATGEARLLSETPVPVRLIDEEEIRKSAAVDVADLLKRAPGIPVMSQGISQRGGVSGLSLQGIAANRTLVLVDGRPMAGDVGGVTDLAQFPADILERVEIVEGPMSAMYGSAALGGVINLITRHPPYGGRVSGRVQGGTDRSVQGAMNVSASSKKGYAWAATATFNHSGAIDLDKSNLATDLDRRTALGMRVLAGVHRDDQHLEFSGMYTHDARTGVLQNTNNAINFTETYESPKRYDRFLGSMRGRHAFPHKKAEAQWSVDVTDYSASLVQDLVDSPETTDRRTRAGLVSTQGAIHLRALPWLTGVIGGRWQRESLRVEQNRTLADGSTVKIEDVIPSSEITVEPWAQADLRLFGDALEIVPGVRLSVQQAYGVAVAPALAFRFRLWRGASFRISGGRGYRAPSLKDRFLVFDHAALGYVVYGDADLVPESNWGANASFEQQVGKVLNVRIGGFANRLEDLITFVYDGAASTSGLNVYRSTNVEGARTLGAQATVDLKLRRWLRATAAYRFVAAWSDDGFQLPDAPMHGLRTTIEGTIPKIELVLFTGVSWESERTVDVAGTLTSPGMVRWDVRVSRTIDKQHLAAAYVQFDNILNQRRDPSREGDFRPVEGFRVVLGVRGALRFDP